MRLIHGSGTLPGGDFISSVGNCGINSGELRVGVEISSDSHWDKA